MTTERRIARYGFRPSLRRHDEPDADVDGLIVATEVDPRDVLGPIVENQWALGSCTSNATATCFRYDAVCDGTDPGQLARLQIYWGERRIEGMIGKGDTGAEGHDAFTVARSGLALETAWPYEWAGITQDRPAPESYFDPKALPRKVVDAAVAYKLTRTVAVVDQTETAIKRVLSNRQTVAFGFTVYESFESAEVASTGIVPMPTAGEEVLGGHEVLAVGYLRSEPRYALCMNSWGSRQTDGSAWGVDGSGFFLLPWSYLLNRKLASDLRTIVRPLAA